MAVPVIHTSLARPLWKSVPAVWDQWRSTPDEASFTGAGPAADNGSEEPETPVAMVGTRLGYTDFPALSRNNANDSEPE